MSIEEHKVQTSRLQVFYRQSGQSGTPVVFLHGNVSSSVFYCDNLQRLPSGFYGIAPDLRGFGDTESAPIDATRGVSDFSDDLYSLMQALKLTEKKIYLAGWSAGAGVAMQYAIDHPEHLLGVILLAPVSPYGFGGTKDLSGTPCYSDFAGSGAGATNPDFVARLGQKDRSSDAQTSPRNVMNGTYVKPPFRLPQEEEERGLDSMLQMRLGPDHYPGDSQSSTNWPGVAPGTRGMNNTLAPKYFNVSRFANIKPQPKVLWVRGADDQIVSDTSFFDFGFLGQLGIVPGWPGAEVFPPQPMVGQMRAMLDTYKQNGGSYEELVFENCAHSPHLEKRDEFHAALDKFLR